MASTVDLGRAVGATGPKGDTGQKGATGPAGPKGADGTKIILKHLLRPESQLELFGLIYSRR